MRYLLFILFPLFLISCKTNQTEAQTSQERKVFSCAPATLSKTLQSKLEALPFDSTDQNPLISITGTLKYFSILPLNPSTEEHYEAFLISPDGKRYELKFILPAVDLRTGMKLEIFGRANPVKNNAIHSGLATEAIVEVISYQIKETNVNLAELSLSNTTGPQTTAVILLSFSDKATSYTQTKAKDVIFNQVSNFWLENSYQQTSISGDVFGPYTIATTQNGCNPDAIASQAVSVAQLAGVSFSKYRHIVYVFPSNTCSWVGLGTIGGSQQTEAWINGDLALHTCAHELGHNLGLYHSNASNCGSATIGSSCAKIEYGDTLDTMGTNLPGHYNAYQKERLGWLGAKGFPAITTVTQSGTYFIDPLETMSNQSKALKILKSSSLDSSKNYYYFEYRQPIGFDSVLASGSSLTSLKNNFTSSLIIHSGNSLSGNTSLLYNMTPTSSSWRYPGLGVGSTFSDSSIGLEVTLLSATSIGATVSVRIADSPTTPPVSTDTPLVLAYTDQSQYIPGDSIFIKSSAVLANGGAVSSAPYTLVITQPDGVQLADAGTLDSNGAVEYTLQTTQCAPRGEYLAIISTSVDGTKLEKSFEFSIQ